MSTRTIGAEVAMGTDAGRSTDEWMAELSGRAERAFGAERRAALETALEGAAASLWRLDKAPFEMLDDEPDFVGGIRPAAGEE